MDKRKKKIKNDKPRFNKLSQADKDDIDELIMESGFSRSRIADIVKDKFGYEFTERQFRYRQKKLEKKLNSKIPGIVKENDLPEIKSNRALSQVVAKQSRSENYKTNQAFKKIEDKLITFTDGEIETVGDESERADLLKVRDNILSKVRYARELFTEVPYVSYLNYTINLLQVRIAKRFEMESKLNLMMKDTSYDLSLMVDVIEKAVKIQQSLGMMPKVDQTDPLGQVVNNNNIQVNQNISVERQNNINAYRNFVKKDKSDT